MKSEPPSPPRDEDVDGERPLERLVPELIKRIVEAGVERLSEGPENVRRVVADLKLPREVLAAVLSQLDETKTGLYRVVAREVRDILSETSLADELAKALTSLSFEIRTTVRFVPNDAKKRPSPEVRSSVAVHRDSQPPAQPPEQAPSPSPPTSASTSSSTTSAPESSRKPQ